eukprot:266934-Chlamydomonas_euryale.AAC.1
MYAVSFRTPTPHRPYPYTCASTQVALTLSAREPELASQSTSPSLESFPFLPPPPPLACASTQVALMLSARESELASREAALEGSRQLSLVSAEAALRAELEEEMAARVSVLADHVAGVRAHSSHALAAHQHGAMRRTRRCCCYDSLLLLLLLLCFIVAASAAAAGAVIVMFDAPVVAAAAATCHVFVAAASFAALTHSRRISAAWLPAAVREGFRV